MTAAYRTPSPVPPEPAKPHRGPRAACPFCGDVGHHDPQACVGASFLRRALLGGCQILAPHLHETCRHCGGTWIDAPAGDP